MPKLPGIGDEFAGYRVRSVIGRGAVSTVYDVEHPRMGGGVALKVLAAEVAADVIFRARFFDESRIAAGMGHPHIIPIYDVGESDGLLYIAMRRVLGGDLRQRIGRRPVAPPTAVALLSQAALALDAAHRNGLVHRNVKPENLLVEGGDEADPGRLFLADFGISKLGMERNGLTSTGRFLGTVDYVAPEQLSEPYVYGSADQYSLGIVLYECLTGELPFEKDPDRTSARERRGGLALRADLPPAVEELFTRALAKRPGDRYNTCREFMEAASAAVADMATAPASGDDSDPIQAEPEPVESPSAPAAPASATAAADLVQAPVPAAATAPAQAPAPAPVTTDAPAAATVPATVPAPATATAAAAATVRAPAIKPAPDSARAPAANPAPDSTWVNAPALAPPTRPAPAPVPAPAPAPATRPTPAPALTALTRPTPVLAPPSAPAPAAAPPFAAAPVPADAGYRTPPDTYQPQVKPRSAGYRPESAPDPAADWWASAMEPPASAAGGGGSPNGRRRVRWLVIAAVLLLVCAGGAVFAFAGLSSHKKAPAAMPSAMASTPMATRTPASTLTQVLTAANASKVAMGMLPASSCRQLTTTKVVCTAPSPSISSVSFTVYPNLTALFAAYEAAVRSLNHGHYQQNVQDCGLAAPNDYGEIAWNHREQHSRAYSVSAMVSGKVSVLAAMGRMACMTTAGHSEDVVWTTDYGTMLGVAIGSGSHTGVWDWWIAVHHNIIFPGTPMDMGSSPVSLMSGAPTASMAASPSMSPSMAPSPSMSSSMSKSKSAG